MQLSAPSPAASLLHSVPLPSILFDLAALLFSLLLLLLSLSSAASLFYLHDRSRRSLSLLHFTSLFPIRLLLASLSALWSLNDILRRRYLFPFHDPLSVDQESSICRFNVVVSLGFLQPCFLLTLLYLINSSIKQRNPNSTTRAIPKLILLSSPFLILQILCVYFAPAFASRLPKFMYASSVVAADLRGEKMVLCACPFFSWVVYGGFALAYGVAFSVSCWRVMAVVINKGTARRINALATTVMAALPAQIVCLCLSWVWIPDSDLYGAMVLTMFLSVAACMAAALLLLVLRPVQEALDAGAVDEEEERHARPLAV